MGTEKLVTDGVKIVANAAETLVKKAWSILDAAAEKEAPSEVLTDIAIKAIQGTQDN